LAKSLSLIAVFAALMLLSLAGMAGLTLRERLNFPPELEIARAGEAKIPVRLRKDLVSVLDSGPLDQAALNLLFSIDVREGANDERLSGLLEALGDLGWRSTPAQRNMVYEALLADDLEEGIRRIDALLRRDRMRAEIVPVLHQLEQRGDVTDALVGRMERMPNWRRGYFASANHIVDTPSCQARARIFDGLAAGTTAASRAEMKPSLDACLGAGEYRLAMDLAGSAVPGMPNSSGLNKDADFAIAAALTAQGRWHALPGEWEMMSRRGLNVTALQREGRSLLSIRWDGRGAPLYVRQFVGLNAVTRPVLEITGFRDQDVQGLAQLRPEWMCPDQAAQRFDLKAVNREKMTASYELLAPSSCDFGWLRLVAAPSRVSGSISLEISKVVLSGSATDAVMR